MERSASLPDAAIGPAREQTLISAPIAGMTVARTRLASCPVRDGASTFRPRTPSRRTRGGRAERKIALAVIVVILLPLLRRRRACRVTSCAIEGRSGDGRKGRPYSAVRPAENPTLTLDDDTRRCGLRYTAGRGRGRRGGAVGSAAPLLSGGSRVCSGQYGSDPKIIGQLTTPSRLDPSRPQRLTDTAGYAV